MTIRIKYLECAECEDDNDLSLCLRNDKETILCEECFEKIDSFLTHRDIQEIKADMMLDQWKDERMGRN